MPYKNNQRYVVNVPKRSGFDKSHRNSGTGKCGTLIPILCDEVIPGSRVSLKLNIASQMPPLASDTYMNVKLKAEAFFVPSRLLCASFEDFFCDFPRRVYINSDYSSGTSSGAFSDVIAALPVFRISGELGSRPSAIFAPGTLLDYLGFKVGTISPIASGSYCDINPLPLIAYHLIWQEYYRNPRVQNPAFAPNLGVSNFASANSSSRVPTLPFNYYHRSFVANVTSPDNSLSLVANDTLKDFFCADGKSIFALRQRNFGLDYFSSARVDPQQGNPSSVSFNVDTATGDGSITIAALRAANSLQQFRERNNLPSPRLVDQVKARYGANLSDGVAQRPICIGSASYDMYSNGVNQTANNSETESSIGNNNPFNTVAAQYGRAYGSGSDFIISDFTANEPGYIMVLISQVPEVSYSYGVLPMFRRYLSEGSIVDMACSLLQNVGDQPIYVKELMNTPNSIAGDSIFGYTDRFADWMFIPNQVHGQFRDGQSLASFVAQRALGGNVELSSSFLEIPDTYLDDVFAVGVDNMQLTYWYDALLDYKVSMPLAEYSIPSLQDPAYEHGERVVLRRNGQIF